MASDEETGVYNPGTIFATADTLVSHQPGWVLALAGGSVRDTLEVIRARPEADAFIRLDRCGVVMLDVQADRRNTSLQQSSDDGRGHYLRIAASAMTGMREYIADTGHAFLA